MGARADAEIYAEVASRIERMPSPSVARSLSEVIALLGNAAGDTVASTEPAAEQTPEWLVRRLRDQAGLSPAAIDVLSPEQAMEVWEAHITGQR